MRLNRTYMLPCFFASFGVGCSRRILSKIKPSFLFSTDKMSNTTLNNKYKKNIIMKETNKNDDFLSFGASNGESIDNKNSILDEIDAALGVHRPPDLEVILTDHVCYTGNWLSKQLHLKLLRFGHAAVRYTTKDGKSRVMNILGGEALKLPGARMVNFIDPKEYFYGTSGFDTYNQQGGVYNRDFVTVRIERVSEGAIEAMHAYFKALHKRSAINTDSSLNLTDVGDDFTSEFLAPLHDSKENTKKVISSLNHYKSSHGSASSSSSLSSLSHQDIEPQLNNKTNRNEAFTLAEKGEMGESQRIRNESTQLLPSQRMGPGGKGRGAARFGLFDGRFESFKRHLGISTIQEMFGAMFRKNPSSSSPSSLSSSPLSSPSPLSSSSIHDRTRKFTSQYSNRMKQRMKLSATEAKKRVRRAVGDEPFNAGMDVREATSAFGNCAQWTSQGLEFAGFIPRSRLFPKSILIHLLESEYFSGRENNVHVVVHKYVKHAQRKDPGYEFLKSAYTHPLHWVRNIIYSDMYPFADVIVEVPPDSKHAIVRTQYPKRPPRWQPFWQATAMIIPPIGMIAAVNKVGLVGPVIGAFIYLLLNWWLH